MNSVKLQDTKLVCRNMLHFYTLITNYQKEIKKTIPFMLASKIPRNKFNQGGERHVLLKL